jgi:hypothetical protein
MATRDGRYRIRTWLRGKLPGRLSDLFPKGEEDCGRHEWYRSDESTWRCYHSERSPWSPLEQADISVAALRSLDQSERQRDLSEPEKELRLTLARDLLAVARELQSSTPAPAGAEQISGAISQ